MRPLPFEGFQMKFAYVMSTETGAVNRALTSLAMTLLDSGIKVVGTTQHDTPRPKSDACDMDVRVLPDGDVIRISQDLGPNSRGCRLDAGALEQAVAQTLTRLDGAQVLIVNKFGKHEAEGRGFREVIATAMDQGIPVVVGTNGLNIDAFRAFCGDLAVPLPAEASALVTWVQAQLRAAA